MCVFAQLKYVQLHTITLSIKIGPGYSPVSIGDSLS